MIWLSVPFTWPLISTISKVTDDYGLLHVDSVLVQANDAVMTISSGLAAFL